MTPYLSFYTRQRRNYKGYTQIAGAGDTVIGLQLGMLFDVGVTIESNMVAMNPGSTYAIVCSAQCC